MLWYSIFLCAIGAATQGWDQTGSNGANLSFPREFGIDGTGKDEWIVGLVNAIIFLTAGLMYVQSCQSHEVSIPLLETWKPLPRLSTSG